MTVCGHPSPWELCSGHFNEAVPNKRWSFGEVHYATRINTICNDTNKLCLLHIQHQCFKQNHKKEQNNVYSSLYLH